MKSILTTSLLLSSILATSVQAASLTLGIAAEQPSMDPHYSRTSPNQATASQFFERLVRYDQDMRMQPHLAESWRQLDLLTWEIKLRQGVKFSDGSDFDAADVVYTVKRIPQVQNSPASFDSDVAKIISIEAKDAHTLIVKLSEASPRFIKEIGNLYILPSELALDVSSDDFNNGPAMIGTGPYQFVEWRRGEFVKAVRNPHYWGKQPHFDEVTFRFITNGASRVASLLSGSVDMIEDIPTQDLPNLQSKAELQVWQKASARLIYLHMDSNREQTPFITAKDGSAINNPLRDARVRQALSLLIDRQAISERIMRGAAEPTGQFVPAGLEGFIDNFPVPQANVEQAKALLAEAGYGDGFKMVLHSSNNRYQNDAQVIQAVAQLLSRGGLEVAVEVMPANVYFKRASALDFSMFLMGFGSSTGSSLRGLNQVLHTYDKDLGHGLFNRGRYSNSEFDRVIESAEQEADPAQHEELLQLATQVAMEDYGILPLYFEKQTWAARQGLIFETGRQEATLAADIRQ